MTFGSIGFKTPSLVNCAMGWSLGASSILLPLSSETFLIPESEKQN